MPTCNFLSWVTLRTSSRTQTMWIPRPPSPPVTSVPSPPPPPPDPSGSLGAGVPPASVLTVLLATPCPTPGARGASLINA
eukprot:3830284-Prorocentrum_lima.AAC.1